MSFDHNSRSIHIARLQNGGLNLQKVELDKENANYTFSSSSLSPTKKVSRSTFDSSQKVSYAHNILEKRENTPYDSQFCSRDGSASKNHNMKRNSIRHNHTQAGNMTNFEIENSMDNDTEFSSQDATMLIKSLNETKDKLRLVSKELSKSKHENTVLQLHLRKSEIKMKELIENHSLDQAKLNELNHQNNQLTIELSKLKTDTFNSTNKTKENVENLKKDLNNVENLVEQKNKSIVRYVKQMKMAFNALQNFIESSEYAPDSPCNRLFENLQEIMNRILSISGCVSLEDLKNIEEKADFEILLKMKELVARYEAENRELKDRTLYLSHALKKEEAKNKDIFPQYREIIAQLKGNVQKIKEKLEKTQIQQNKERKNLLVNLQGYESSNQDLLGENERLKEINSDLAQKLRSYEAKIVQNEDKLRDLLKDHQKLEQTVKAIKLRNLETQDLSKPIDRSLISPALKKGCRSHSRGHNAYDRVATEGDEAPCRNFPSRSSSVLKEKPYNVSGSHKGDIISVQKLIDPNVSFDCMEKTSHMPTKNGRENRLPLDQSFEVQKAKFSHTVQVSGIKAYYHSTPKKESTEASDSIGKYCVHTNHKDSDREQGSYQLKYPKNKNYCGNYGERLYVKPKKGVDSEKIVTKNESFSETSFNDLEEEITSLDNEINTIEKYMRNANIDI